MADLVLPATHFLEHQEISRGYGSYVLFRTPPVVEPAAEARPNPRVFAELIQRLDLSRPGEPATTDGLAAALLGRSERMRGELERDGIAHPDCGFAPVQFADSFPLTADRKAHLVPEALDREAPYGLYAFQEDPATPGFPLALISPSTNRTVSSTFGQLVRKRIPLEVHPRDAGVRGIADGDTVRVWNDHGEVRTAARLNPDLRPGVVLLPKGLWSHNTLSGTTANAVAPDTYTDLGQGACFNDARVEVEKVA
jgi:anaerobic selenocysteine-containing dehydrogenase